MLSRKKRLKVGDYFGVGAPKPTQIIKRPLISVKIYTPGLARRSGGGLVFSRCGVVISKGLDKRASARNRVKRAIFDAFGEIIHKLSPADYLFFPSAGLAKLKRSEIIKIIREISF
jgi:RNase P protein component